MQASCHVGSEILLIVILGVREDESSGMISLVREAVGLRWLDANHPGILHVVWVGNMIVPPIVGVMMVSSTELHADCTPPQQSTADFVDNHRYYIWIPHKGNKTRADNQIISGQLILQILQSPMQVLVLEYKLFAFGEILRLEEPSDIFLHVWKDLVDSHFDELCLFGGGGFDLLLEFEHVHHELRVMDIALVIDVHSFELHLN